MFYASVWACKFLPFQFGCCPPVSRMPNFHPWGPPRWQRPNLNHQCPRPSFTQGMPRNQFPPIHLRGFDVSKLHRCSAHRCGFVVFHRFLWHQSLGIHARRLLDQNPWTTRIPHRGSPEHMGRIERFFVISPFFPLISAHNFSEMKFTKPLAHCKVMSPYSVAKLLVLDLRFRDAKVQFHRI